MSLLHRWIFRLFQIHSFVPIDALCLFLLFVFISGVFNGLLSCPVSSGNCLASAETAVLSRKNKSLDVEFGET